MTENGDRMTAFERRLDTMGEDVRVLKNDVGVLKDDVGGLKRDVSTLKQDVSTLKQDVSTLKQDVSTLKQDVSTLKQDVGALKDDVQRLRVLQEEQGTRFQTIAEVQAHHGHLLGKHSTLLSEISKQLAPLGDIRDFIRRTADDHEVRISALEKYTGIQ